MNQYVDQNQNFAPPPVAQNNQQSVQQNFVRPDNDKFLILESTEDVQIDFGGNRFLPHHIVTERFNNAFGFDWNLEVKERWIDKTPYDHIYNVIIRLSVGLNRFREHVGYESFKNRCVKKSGQRKTLSNLNESEIIISNIGDMWKVAISSGIRKVSSLFGVGLQFYRDMYDKNKQNQGGYQPQSGYQPQGNFQQPVFQPGNFQQGNVAPGNFPPMNQG